MQRNGGSRSWRRPGALLGFALLILLVLAGCSTSGTGGSLQLGLAGSTADHPSPPPVLTSNAPGGTFAFVYDNQIWVRDASGLKQITHLVLSNGSTILWGPLVWSPSGRYIAFTLVEDLTPSAPTPTSGPIYVLDVSAGTTVVTPATGSVYGHTFAWLTERALVYSNSGNLMLYDLGDEDPRVWTLRSALLSDGSGYTYTSGSVNYGDVAVTSDGTQLFYTTITVTSLGATGVVGSAEVRRVSLFALGPFVSGTYGPNASSLPDWLANNTDLSGNTPDHVGDLGAVYSGAGGNLVAGAWQMSADGSTLVTQRVNGVDLKGGRVSSTYCVRTSYYGYGDCRQILGGGAGYPIAVRAALAVSGDGSRAALSVDNLYTQGTGGGGQGKAGAAGWSVPPSWSPDGKHVLATQLVSTSTDASGVTRFQTNLIVYDGSSAGAMLIAGGRNPSWKP